MGGDFFLTRDFGEWQNSTILSKMRPLMYVYLCFLFLVLNLSLYCEGLPLHSMLDSRMQRKIESVVLIKSENYDQNYDNFRGNGRDYELELIIGGRGNSPGQFLLPIDLTLIEDEIYVVDFGNQRIQVFDRQGQYQRVLELPEVNQPVQIRIFNNYI